MASPAPQTPASLPQPFVAAARLLELAQWLTLRDCHPSSRPPKAPSYEPLRPGHLAGRLERAVQERGNLVINVTSFSNLSAAPRRASRRLTRCGAPRRGFPPTTDDVTGDGKTDVIIGNLLGSYWYYSTGTGTWNEAYTGSDLPM